MQEHAVCRPSPRLAPCAATPATRSSPPPDRIPAHTRCPAPAGEGSYNSCNRPLLQFEPCPAPRQGRISSRYIDSDSGKAARKVRRRRLERPPLLRAGPGGRQSLPQVGLYRGGEYRLAHAPSPAAPARQSPLCAHSAAEGACDGGRRGRTPLGGSHLLDPDQAGTVPRSGGPPGVVHGGTSAKCPGAPDARHLMATSLRDTSLPR